MVAVRSTFQPGLIYPVSRTKVMFITYALHVFLETHLCSDWYLGTSFIVSLPSMEVSE